MTKHCSALTTKTIIMKFLILLASLFFVIASSAQTTVVSKTNGELEFIELDYGVASVVEGTTDNLGKTPTGTHGWLKDLVITKVTDSIEVAPKANFGVVYMVKAKDTVDINVVIEWIYPKKITNEKGEKFSSIKYTTTRPTKIPSASSYSLDAPYEMVTGEWKLNIYIEKKKVYSKTFTLY
jgi:hypothetical protein